MREFIEKLILAIIFGVPAGIIYHEYMLIPFK
jgi:hypothetical protein